MRRLVVLLVVVVGLVRPAFPDNAGTGQQSVQQQLAAASAEVTQLNAQMAALERSVTDTQQRVVREREQVRMLARALYAQPDSLLTVAFESASLSEAVTRIADLTSAGDRAASAKRALDRDLSRLSEQHDQLQVDQSRTQQLVRQLTDQFSKLVAQATATRVALAPAPPAPTPGGTAAIQQIILNAFAPLGAAAQTWALRVAACESGYNPYAVNRYSGASGLFQFLPSTWAASPEHAQSVFDPTANATAAAWLYNRSGPGQWSCK